MLPDTHPLCPKVNATSTAIYSIEEDPSTGENIRCAHIPLDLCLVLPLCTDGLECTYGSGADVCVCACARVRAFTLACLSGRHFSAADAGCGWLCRLRVRSPRQARRNLCRCRTRPRSHAHSQIAPGVSAVGAQFLNVSRSFLESLGSDVVDPLRRLTTRRAGSTRRDGLLGVRTWYGIFLRVTKHETV